MCSNHVLKHEFGANVSPEPLTIITACMMRWIAQPHLAKTMLAKHAVRTILVQFAIDASAMRT